MTDAAPLPNRQTYREPREGKPWVCERFDRVSSECEGIAPGDLPELHGALENHPRAWRVAAMSFGLRPVIPPLDYPQELRRAWEGPELAAHLGLKAGGLRDELAAVAGVWRALRATRDTTAAADAATLRTKAAEFGDQPQGQLQFTDDEVLGKYGYSGHHFESEEERRLVAERVRDLKAPLDDQMARRLAQIIIDCELHIGRLQRSLSMIKVENFGGTQHTKLENLLKERTATYLDALNDLDEIAAWKGSISGKVSFSGVIGDFSRCFQFAEARGDVALGAHIEQTTGVQIVFDRTQLVDGVFTALELQAALRTSRQRPRPQYRPDIVAAITEAKHNLWNKDYVPAMRPTDAKLLRTGFDGAMAALRERLGLPQPDLLEDGPAGEYPPLVTEATD